LIIFEEMRSLTFGLLFLFNFVTLKDGSEIHCTFDVQMAKETDEVAGQLS
jgi:hypothetical protein